MKTFDTVAQAAVAALAAAGPLASRNGWEYGGWIVKNGNRFSFLPAVTSQKPHSVNLIESMEKALGVDIDINDPAPFVQAIQAAGVVTTYHTHLCWDAENQVQGDKETDKGYSASWFSVSDMFLDEQLQQHPSYIGVSCSGNVYQSPPEPKITKVDWIMAQVLGVDPDGFETNGTLVGNYLV